MILLDTHVWLWLAEGDHIFPAGAVAKIDEAVRLRSLFVSPISLWEISLKVSRSKLSLSLPLRPWIRKALDFQGLHLAAIDAEVACDCAELPAGFHGDPADRIIAATARTTGYTLLTHDRALLRLAREGFLNAEPV